MSWRRVCESGQVKEGELFIFDAEGAKLMLTRLPEGLRALSRVCAHRGADMKDCKPEQGRLTCDAHFWQFDLSDGRCVQVPSAKLRSFEVKVEEGMVYVEL